MASASGLPVACLLPVLSSSLAQDRHVKRIEKALQEIDLHLQNHEEAINALSDEKYKFLNEIILTTLQTVDENKIELLKKISKHSIYSERITHHNSMVLSRIIRDLSAEEFSFLVECKDYENISFVSGSVAENGKYIDKSSKEGEIAVGLINLGVIARGTGEGMVGDTGAYIFMPIAQLIIELIHGENT